MLRTPWPCPPGPQEPPRLRRCPDEGRTRSLPADLGEKETGIPVPVPAPGRRRPGGRLHLRRAHHDGPSHPRCGSALGLDRRPRGRQPGVRGTSPPQRAPR
ncbi:hypothetical protein ADK82_14860 [Streptomyces sp. NRRL S-4]|nr:hypothetical protein ADK82_14860 [Streptomyces sp. NRRL S-4]